jgi:hypothetical protein
VSQRGSGQSNQRISGDGGASGSLSASSESGVGGSSGPTSASLPEQVLDPRYSKLICFNCGDPGHFVGNCVKPKLCFIFNLPSHPVHLCPKWLTEHPSAAYFGSAGKGLGFYHIDVPDESETQWLNFNNCGLISVKKGSISLVELEQNFTTIFCKTRKWPW